MLLDGLLGALLLVAPGQGSSDAPAPSVDAAADGDYGQALERVRKARQMANEDPRRGAVQLRDALQLLRDFGPVLAKDPEGQDLRTMSLLTLSRSLLATEDADGARETMDEAIRTSRGDPLPAEEFGPGLAALYKERAGVLAKRGEGSLSVTCNTPCSIYLNERPVQPLTEGLIPGRYRVWIEDRDGEDPVLQRDVEIAADKTATLEFGTADIVEPPPLLPRKRIMPRWAEGLLMGVGAAAIGTGAVLWAIDGTCPNGADPVTQSSVCPQIYTSQTAGIIAVALGGAVLLGGTITLTVDEVRAKRQRGTQAVLNWTLRF